MLFAWAFVKCLQLVQSRNSYFVTIDVPVHVILFGKGHMLDSDIRVSPSQRADEASQVENRTISSSLPIVEADEVVTPTEPNATCITVSLRFGQDFDAGTHPLQSVWGQHLTFIDTRVFRILQWCGVYMLVVCMLLNEPRSTLTFVLCVGCVGLVVPFGLESFDMRIVRVLARSPSFVGTQLVACIHSCLCVFFLASHAEGIIATNGRLELAKRAFWQAAAIWVVPSVLSIDAWVAKPKAKIQLLFLEVTMYCTMVYHYLVINPTFTWAIPLQVLIFFRFCRPFHSVYV
jgi:hypothetical protein